MGKIPDFWGNIKFHSKNPGLWAAAIILISALVCLYLNKISIADFFNFTLVAALVGVTSLYQKATDRLVSINSNLVDESKKDRRRIYLEKKLENMYVPLNDYLVIHGKEHIHGNDEQGGQFLSEQEMPEFKNSIIKNYIYLADEKLQINLKEILSSSPQNKIPKKVFITTQKMITDELKKYNKELEELTKLG